MLAAQVAEIKVHRDAEEDTRESGCGESDPKLMNPALALRGNIAKNNAANLSIFLQHQPFREQPNDHTRRNDPL